MITCWYGLFVLDAFQILASHLKGSGASIEFQVLQVPLHQHLSSTTNTTIVTYQSPQAARWYHESGGQERGGICWGWAWLIPFHLPPIAYPPGSQAWMAPSFAALPKRGHRLQTLAAKHLLLEPWGFWQSSWWIKLANFAKLVCPYIVLQFVSHCYIIFTLGFHDFHAIPWNALWEF